MLKVARLQVNRVESLIERVFFDVVCLFDSLIQIGRVESHQVQVFFENVPHSWRHQRVEQCGMHNQRKTVYEHPGGKLCTDDTNAENHQYYGI